MTKKKQRTKINKNFLVLSDGVYRKTVFVSKIIKWRVEK